jgi:dsRNA-specific ribonuclease
MAKQVDTQEWWERTIDEAANENMDNSFLEPISKTGAEVLKGFIGSIVAETKIKTVEEMIQKINKLLIPQAYKDKNQTMWNTAIREVINLLESNE